MMNTDTDLAIEQLKRFARRWNELYAAARFEEMKLLASEDVGIANSQASVAPTGLIYGRQAYYDGIYGAYSGATGEEHNLLVMEYEGWEYIPLGNADTFYTIGRYTLEPDVVGVNCWLLRREASDAPWQIFRVINT